jgi:hypothetical protein
MMEYQGKRLFIAYEDDPRVQFAAMELVRYLRAMTGHTIYSGTEFREGCFNICLATDERMEQVLGISVDFSSVRYDGFLIKSFPDRLCIGGKVPRSAAYGVYWLLEQWGCRWLYPGADGEFLPKYPVLRFDLDTVQNPDFEIRGFMEDGGSDFPYYNVQELMQLIDWSFKNRMNSYMRHYSAMANIPFRDTLIPAIKTRGMLFEFGGHGTQNLIPRSLFDTKPSLFRMQNGERLKNGNLCVSNPEARQMIVDGVLKIFSNNPEIDVLRLWYEDLEDGGWCECDQCKPLSPVEQQFVVQNQIAAAVKEKFPGKAIDVIFYHDTLDCSRVRSIPESNIYGFIAPRERCYAHSIDDANCRRNRQYYYPAFRSLKDKFDHNAYIMEYYADMILYNKIATDFSKTIAADLRAYSKMGIRRINCLMFGRYSWWATKRAMYTFTRSCWDTTSQLDIREYAGYLYGEVAEKITGILEGIEEASKEIFQFCEYDQLMDIRIIPAQSKEFYRKHLDGLLASHHFFAESARQINELMGRISDPLLIRRLDELRLILLISSREALATYNHNSGFYGCSYVEGYTQEQLDEAINKTLLEREEMVKLIQSLPFEMAGINGKGGVFVNHLCKDLNGWCEGTGKHFGKHPHFKH